MGCAVEGVGAEHEHKLGQGSSPLVFCPRWSLCVVVVVRRSDGSRRVPTDGSRRVPTGSDGVRRGPTESDGVDGVPPIEYLWLTGPTESDGVRRSPTGPDGARRSPTEPDGARRSTKGPPGTCKVGALNSKTGGVASDLPRSFKPSNEGEPPDFC